MGGSKRLALDRCAWWREHLSGGCLAKAYTTVAVSCHLNSLPLMGRATHILSNTTTIIILKIKQLGGGVGGGRRLGPGELEPVSKHHILNAELISQHH